MWRNDYIVIVICEIFALEIGRCTLIIFIVVVVFVVTRTISLYNIVKGWEQPLCVDLDG